MSRLIWIYAICKSLLLSSVEVKELRECNMDLLKVFWVTVVFKRCTPFCYFQIRSREPNAEDVISYGDSMFFQLLGNSCVA